MIIQCDRCKKSYYMRPSYYKRYKKHFCSVKCYGESEKGENNPNWKDTDKICPICLKKFKPTRLKANGEMRYTIFCSKKCAQTDKSKRLSREIECVICKKKIKVKLSRIFKENCCSLACTYKLHSKRMSAEGNSNWRGGIGNFPWHHSFNKELKKKIKNRDGDRCRLCGLSNEEIKSKKRKGYGIQIHHIDYDKENNSEENLISLCNKCHGKVNYDKEKWRLKLSKILRG